MKFRQRAKITVCLTGLGYEKSKYFFGTEYEVIAEANDWMYVVALQFIEENDIEDEYDQAIIIESATHIIEWDADPMCMYAVIEQDTEDPVCGIYPTLADAEEAILTECQDWAYEVMMTEDPEDVLGDNHWEWADDYRLLMRDAGQTFHIQEVPMFGIEEIIA